MLKFLVFKIFLLVIGLNAFAVEMPVVVRDKKFNAKIQHRLLPHLTSDNAFDGKFFKVVLGTKDEAISFDAPEEIVLKAATTYYHLNIARDYFVNVVKSEKIKNLKKMIIRIEMTRQFFELGKYANENMEPIFNTAITIPARPGFPSRGVQPWDTEIWFRPKKDIHIDELNLRSNVGQIDSLFRAFRDQIHMMTFQRFLASLINTTITNPNPNATSNLLDSSLQIVSSSIIMELFYQFREPLTKLTSRKYFGLETALIPEVIYHEFAHVALSDTLALTHESPVVEGLADIFAVMISGGSKIATNIKKYNTFDGKKAKRKQDYQIQFENSNYANSDYVLGMLWSVKEIVGEKSAPAFMYTLSKKVNSSANIRDDLVQGINLTCSEICSNPFSQRIEIFKKFSQKKM
jgi:hypothetical protein